MNDLSIERLKQIKKATAAHVKTFGKKPVQDPLNALAYCGLQFLNAVLDELIKEGEGERKA